MNPDPALVRADGVACPVPATSAPARAACPRTILVVSHNELPIAPVPSALVVAHASEKATSLKSASVKAVQRLALEQSDGASAIHSAELVSTIFTVTVLANASCLVASASVRVTRLPATPTPAVRRSPASTVIRIFLLVEGTSSYPA